MSSISEDILKTRRRRTMRFKSRWEILLVLIVLAAGIVITTIAAIKAKEKRQILYDEGGAKSLGEGRHIPDSSNHVQHRRPKFGSSAAGDTFDDGFNFQPEFMSGSEVDTVNKPNRGENTYEELGMPDYDAEYDNVGAMTGASDGTNLPPAEKVAAEYGSDNLPGFPPPIGAAKKTTHLNNKAELAADGAGFIVDDVSSAMGTSQGAEPASNPASGGAGQVEAAASGHSDIRFDTGNNNHKMIDTPRTIDATAALNNHRVPLMVIEHPAMSAAHHQFQDPHEQQMALDLQRSRVPIFADPVLGSIVGQPTATQNTNTPKFGEKLTAIAKQQQQQQAMMMNTLGQAEKIVAESQMMMAQKKDGISPRVSVSTSNVAKNVQQPNNGLQTRGQLAPQASTQHVNKVPMQQQSMNNNLNVLNSHLNVLPAPHPSVAQQNLINMAGLLKLADRLAQPSNPNPVNLLFHPMPSFGMPYRNLLQRSKRSVRSGGPHESHPDDYDAYEPEQINQANWGKSELLSTKIIRNEHDRMKTASSSHRFGYSDGEEDEIPDDEPPTRPDRESAGGESHEIGSLFDYDDDGLTSYRRRKPGRKSSRRRKSSPPSSSSYHHHHPSRHHHDPFYTPEAESSSGHHYGILGSGNFEIIRGGIFGEEDAATNSVPAYVKRGQKEGRGSRRYKGHRHHHDEPRYRGSSSRNSANDDFYSRNPVLGFQGYDNFGAAASQQPAIAADATESSVSNLEVASDDYYASQTPVSSHHQQPRTSSSQQVVIYSDKDLDVAA